MILDRSLRGPPLITSCARWVRWTPRPARIKLPLRRSSDCTGPNDCDFMEDNLPKLSATHISVCRRDVLQQAVQSLGFSMHETTTYDDESNEILTAVQIDVPSHIRLARFETRLFYGDWSQTSDAAIQSACFNALVYLQKANILVIDGIHSAELKHCKRELLQASFWGEAFEEHASQLRTKLNTMVKDKMIVLPISQNQSRVNLMQSAINTVEKKDEQLQGRLLVSSGPAQSSLSKYSAVEKGKTSVLPISQNQAKVCMTQETADTKKCADKHLLAPSGPANMPQNIVERGTLRGIPFVALPNNNERPPIVFRFNGNLPFGRRRRRDPVPVPEPALASSNRKKRKLIINSRHLGSSLKYMSAAVTGCSDGTAHVSPIQIDHECTLPSLSTPASVSRTVSLSKEIGPLYSKVRKALFQASENKDKAADLGDQVLVNTGDLGESDEKPTP